MDDLIARLRTEKRCEPAFYKAAIVIVVLVYVMVLGADRASRAGIEPTSSLDHTATIPSAGGHG